MATPPGTSPPRRVVRVLLGVSGSVAAIKTGEVIQEIYEAAKERGFEAEVGMVATEKGLFFLPKCLRPFVHDNRREWLAWRQRGDPVMHIELRRWADLFVIAPLSANTLAKLAAGLCDDLLSCVARAWDYGLKPLVAAPAMNPTMWRHRITATQLEAFKQFGAIVSDVWTALGCMGSSWVYRVRFLKLFDVCVCIKVISPIEKRLVCGETASSASNISSSSGGGTAAAPAAEHCLGAMPEPSVLAKEAFEVFCGFPLAPLPPPHHPHEAPPSIVTVDQQQLSAAAAAAAAAPAAAAKWMTQEEETGSLVKRQHLEPLMFLREEGGVRGTSIPGSPEAWQLTARQLLEKPIWGFWEVIAACMSLKVLLGGDGPSRLTDSLRARLKAQGESRLIEAFRELVEAQKHH
ncbi:hypothetical protein Esti_002545 [Eimeria stiedai]